MIIEFDNVTKTYGDGTEALTGIDLKIEEGTTTVFVGPSGCGKTTTMRLVNQLEEPTTGTISFRGDDIQSLDEIELRRQMGYVIQEVGLFDHMTVGENIATVPRLLNWDDDRISTRVNELLDLMNLPPESYRDQFPRELSGGQRQRIGVARALAADPDIMLMDEPFGSLDPVTREEVQDEFLEIQKEINTTILFVTHSIQEALKMGDKIAIYDVGRVVQYDTPESILESPATDFVKEFIGQDRYLKKLQISEVGDVMTNGKTPNELPNGAKPISPTTNAQVALSYLLKHDLSEIPVEKNGKIIGSVSESAVRDIIRESEQ